MGKTLRPLVATLLLSAISSAVPELDLLHGRRLFSGEEPLSGTILGHKSTLPPAAAKCTNCHSSGDEPLAQSLGPLLNRRSLTEMQSRRGAPPSRYTEATFCRILRTGVDPAYIFIAQEMPRYVIDDSRCRDLWAYLSRE